MSTILIGIAGGTGSGKTTLTRHLKEHFGPEVTVIGHDNYYKRQDGKTLEERAVEERGRTLQSVVTQYLTTVKPMHEQYVEPSRKFADIIVLEGGRNLVALEMIMQRIRAHIDTP